jgi:hypothetical protein
MMRHHRYYFPEKAYKLVSLAMSNRTSNMKMAKIITLPKETIFRQDSRASSKMSLSIWKKQACILFTIIATGKALTLLNGL